jgi:uncharacterized OB-fold protein
MRVEGSRAALRTRSAQEELKRQGLRPWPVADDVSRPFWEAATRGRLVLQRCADCGRFHHPPVAECPDCAGAPEWIEASGRGTVYSFIVDHRNMVPGFYDAYVVALVTPDEVDDDSVRLVTNLPGCPADEVRIGMRVRVTFDEVRPGVWLPQFERDESGA